jgi:competence protein ComEC
MKRSFRRFVSHRSASVSAGAAGFCLTAIILLAGLGAQAFAAPAKGALDVYFIDVEGGQSTLFVTPAGESLLIDTGWPGNNGRDADRIVAAAKLAGLKKIDYVLITHYHDDHVGGVPQLVERIPVGTFIDHGPNRETTDAHTEQNWEAYQKVLATHPQRNIVKPGDKLPLKGLDATVISADGALIGNASTTGVAANPYCASSPHYDADVTENGRSVGVLFTFGKLRLLDLGDLTADKELQLMCPGNRLGKVDVYIVSHHGWYQSSSRALVHAIAPRLAIMDNGAKKGGSPAVVDTIQQSPGLESLWQLHYSDEGGAAHNAAESYIANLTGTDTGHYLKLTANHDGSMDVFNARTQKTQHYAAR